LIYTTYFGNLRKLPSDIVPIAICAKVPDWYKGLHYKAFAPKYDFFIKYKQDGDEKSFTEQYYSRVLFNLCPYDEKRKLFELSNGKDIVLVCYEKDDFCHRHLVAKFFNQVGIECIEWKEK